MSLLKRLTLCASPSGREDSIRELILDEIKDLCDSYYTDALGNLIAKKGVGGEKITVLAHMDEIGIVVTYKDEKGFLKFAPVGGLDKANLVGRRVVFKDGTIGVIGIYDDADKKEYNKMYIDTNCEGDIAVGDMATFVGEYYENGNTIVSKALDNRAGCYVLIEALKALQKTKNELTFVFSVQEEVGLRGAKAFGGIVEADKAIAVDVTATGDTPECAPNSVKLGEGVAIKIMDSSIICRAEIRDELIHIATDNNIPFQLEVLTHGGTDAGAIHTSGAGIKTGAISIPCRYIHSVSEMINKKDLEASINLLVSYLK